jgi:nicotinamide riboside transporter PnuC
MTILFVVGLSLAVALPWRAFIPEGHPMYHPFPILDMFQLSLAVAGLYLGIKRICEMHLLYVISAFLGMIIYAMAGSFVMIVSIFGYLIVGSLSYFTWMAAIDKEV